MSGYIDPTKEDFARFREMTREGPVHMLNLLRFRERAVYPDGTEATGAEVTGAEVTGAEAYRSYARESAPVLERLGGRQVWIGRPN